MCFKDKTPDATFAKKKKVGKEADEPLTWCLLHKKQNIEF